MVLVTLAVAAASLWNLVSFKLEHLMRPSWPEMTMLAWYAAFAVILAAAAVAFWSKRWWVLVPALAIVLAAGFLPRVADPFALAEKVAEDQAEGAEFELEFQEAHLEWSDDIATRAADGPPWTADEGFAFLDFAATSDLTWRSLPDHTPQAFALVEEALAENVLDPDALTTATPVADSPAVTLTLLWYDRRIRPGSPRAIKRHDWEILQMLVAAGADLTADDAASLRADLAKTVIDGGGRFISLEWGEVATPPEPEPEPESEPPAEPEPESEPPAEPEAGPAESSGENTGAE
jgi:hypothetical protein